jgi:hypothetical protein
MAVYISLQVPWQPPEDDLSILGTEKLLLKYLPAPTMPICQHFDAIPI